MIKYWTGAHTKHRLVYHIVIVPKYRRRILIGKVGERIRSLMYKACEINRWWIHEIEVRRDHVHIMIQLRPNVRISEVVQILKGGTSRRLRKEMRELEEFEWGESFWSEGYFAETNGKISEYRLKEYIRNQHSSMTREG